MMYYNKAIVAVVMALLHYLNQTYGYELPMSEEQADLLVGLLISFLVWAVPNKAPKE